MHVANSPESEVRIPVRSRSITILLLVLVAVGVCSSLAIRAYQDFSLRARMSEVIMMIQPVKAAMAACVQQHGRIGRGVCDSISALKIAPLPQTAELAELRIEPGSGKIIAVATQVAGGYSYTLEPRPERAQLALHFEVGGTCPREVCGR